MTITDLLADLEAKATQVLTVSGPDRFMKRIEFRNACSPEDILALVAWVKKVALPIIRTMAGNEPVFPYGVDGAESGMRCCFACGVEASDDGTPFQHDADCAHLVAQETLAGHLDTPEEEK